MKSPSEVRGQEEEKKAGEIVREMLAEHEIMPEDSGVKEVIERVSEYEQLFQCALCLSLVYDPYQCSSCEMSLFCLLCLKGLKNQTECPGCRVKPFNWVKINRLS